MTRKRMWLRQLMCSIKPYLDAVHPIETHAQAGLHPHHHARWHHLLCCGSDTMLTDMLPSIQGLSSWRTLRTRPGSGA